MAYKRHYRILRSGNNLGSAVRVLHHGLKDVNTNLQLPDPGQR
ncbi:hypothetical protein [Ottowia caeni]